MLHVCLILVIFCCKGVVSQSTLQYRLTIRDFLPSHCLRASEYESWWEYSYYRGLNDTVYEEFETLPDDFYANRTGLIDFSDWYGPSYVGRENDILVKHYCPYWTKGMRAGNISGHPDFEAATKSLEDGPSNCTYGGASQTCGVATSVIKTSMKLATSGLPKLQYCDDDDMARCGKRNNKYLTSRGKFFHSWYNDDSKYNKRIGVTIPLESDDEGTFTYASSEFFPMQSYNKLVFEETYPDPQRAPIWPSAIRDFHQQHYWFTTEFHSYFEYSGNETFRFMGDDDFWAFINDKLAIDLGGLHGNVAQSIKLSDYSGPEYLNLTVGEVYSFSVFHAERHFSASNFRIDTTISEACNVAKPGSASTAFSLLESTEATLAVSNSVEILPSGVVQLSNSSLGEYSTWLFTKNQQNIGAGFVATFTFQIRNEASVEGIAFVATRRPEGLDNIPVATGSGLGFRFLTHSVAVAIDMCSDRNSSEDACEEQTVRIQYPDDPEDTNESANAYTRVYDGIMRSLRYSDTEGNPEVHKVRIEYLQRPDWLQVYIDDSLYLRQTNFDLEDIIGGRDAYIGLTSATSAGREGTLEILDFTLETVAVEATKTEAGNILPDAEMQTIYGDGKHTAGFTLQTRDMCGNDVQNGGVSELMKAWYIPVGTAMDADESLRRLLLANGTDDDWFIYPDDRVEAEIVDNLDGSYTASFASTDAGLYALYACFGDGCGYNWTSTDIEPLDNSSFYSHVDIAVLVNPLTASPTHAPQAYVPVSGNDTVMIKYASIGGGIAGLLLLSALLFVFVFRRRWRHDKGYIENGKLYNLERAVEYNPNDEYNVVTRMVMDSSAKLQYERSRLTPGDGAGDITALTVQNQELQEQIRAEKQRKQLLTSGSSRLSRMLGRSNKQGRAQRKEFHVDAEDRPQ